MKTLSEDALKMQHSHDSLLCFKQSREHFCLTRAVKKCSVNPRLYANCYYRSSELSSPAGLSRADGTQQKFLSEIPHPNLNQCDFIQIFACSTLLQFTTDYSMDSWIMVPESTGLDDWCLLCRVCTAKPTCHMATEWFSLADLGNVLSCYVQSTSSQIRLLRKGKHEMD